jgi:hypothetical protein
MCRQKAEVTQNRENEHVHGIGKEKPNIKGKTIPVTGRGGP